MGGLGLLACGGGGSARKPEQLLCPPVTPVPAATVLQTSGCAAVVAAQREAYAQIANDPLLGDDWRREIGRCVALGNEAIGLLPLAATRQTHNSRWNDAYGERPPRVLPAAIWVNENSEHVVSETWPTRYPQDFDVQLLPGSNGTQPALIEYATPQRRCRRCFLATNCHSNNLHTTSSLARLRKSCCTPISRQYSMSLPMAAHYPCICRASLCIRRAIHTPNGARRCAVFQSLHLSLAPMPSATRGRITSNHAATNLTHSR